VDEIHLSAERASVEGADVTPDRSVIQPSGLSARCQNCGGLDFPFHVHERANSWQSDSDGEVEGPDSGEQ
jgi:hypothetical protein